MAVQALVAIPAEEIKVIFIVWNVEARKLANAELKGDVAAVGDHLGVVERLRVFFKYRAHFVLGFEVELVGLKLHFILIVHGAAGLDAEQNTVYLRVAFVDVVAVVRGDQPYTCFSGDLHQVGNQTPLLLNSVILQFYKIVVLAKQIAVILSLCPCARVVVHKQALRHLARKARRKADKPLVVLFEQAVVDARLAVKALGKAERNQLYQVLIARVVLAEQHHVEIPLHGVFVKARLRRDVHLAADNGVYALFYAGAVKVDNAVHHAVVGYGKRRKPLPLGGRGYFADTARAVQQTVFGVNV